MNIPFIQSCLPHPEIGFALINLYYLFIQSLLIIDRIPYCDADSVI